MKIAYSLVPLVLLLVLSEGVLRITYFQYTSTDKLALTAAYHDIKGKYVQYRVQAKLGGLRKIARSREFVARYLYEDIGKDVLKELSGTYEQNFKDFVKEANKVDAKILVLYIPLGSYDHDATRKMLDYDRTFFSGLCKKYGVDFLDVSDAYLKYPLEVTTLRPFDAHMSRFGHRIVADEIQKFITGHEDFNSHKSTHVFARRPKVLSIFKPNEDSIQTELDIMPYRVVTNSQGFRMKDDLAFPKTKQRILNLGDSFTFGAYLNNQDIFTDVLNRRFKDKEFVNAGICGSTITDELALFVGKARYVDPDIVILQVLDNDLSGLFYFEYGRGGPDHPSSKTQVDFLEKLQKQPATDGGEIRGK